MLFQQNGGNERDEAVAVDLLAVRRDCPRTVDVGIEDDAEIGMVFFDRRADGLHRRLVLGIGDVVGKAPVGFQKLRTRRVRPQRLQDEVGIKSARAVARVHEDALARKRLLHAR